jgi:hypothetical protein
MAWLWMVVLWVDLLISIDSGCNHNIVLGLAQAKLALGLN